MLNFETITINAFDSGVKGENNTYSFLSFKAKSINGAEEAALLSSQMSKELLLRLDKLKTKDEKNNTAIDKSKAWIDKKAILHPNNVVNVMDASLNSISEDEVGKLPISFTEIHEDLKVAALVHDIGRFSEVDMLTGIVRMGQGPLKKDHAQISFEVLEDSGLKPEIMLAVKYHGALSYKTDLEADPLYKNLSPEHKDLALFYVQITRDSDKVGNLMDYTVDGMRRCGEVNNPAYEGNCKVSDAHKEHALTGKVADKKKEEGNYLDVLTRFVTWTYDIELDASKKALGNTLDTLFDRIYEEVEREHKEYKGLVKDNDTLESLKFFQKLEKYALNERLGHPKNIERDEKVSNLIKGVEKNIIVQQKIKNQKDYK